MLNKPIIFCDPNGTYQDLSNDVWHMWIGLVKQKL